MPCGAKTVDLFSGLYYNVGMEFAELKKHLKSSPPRACYYCYGDDDYVISRAVALISELAAEPKPFNLCDRTFERAEDAVAELMQLPLTGERRVVISRGKLSGESFDKYLANPNKAAVLVITHYIPHDSWSHSAAITVPDGATGVDCNRLPIKYIYPFVRGIASGTGADISDKNIELLYNRCGRYMTRINAEAQKLALLRAGGEISAEDITDTVNADTEFIVYDLCDAIVSADAARALSIVDGMAKNNDLVAAFTLLYNRFKKMFVAAVSPEALPSLGVKPGMAAVLKRESGRFTKVRLKSILDMLANADFSYKTGAMSVDDALVSFVAQACDAR